MQKISKRPIAKQQRMRPKSVLKKAWETRRRNAGVKPLTIDRDGFLKGLGTELRNLNEGLPTQSGAMEPKNAQASPTPRSDNPDPIAALLDQFRDEQLCSFVAEIAAIRHMQGPNSHQPIMLSRPQAEAIEDFLVSEGYGPFGRSSVVRKAA